MKRYERSLADFIKSGPLTTSTIRSISHVLCRTLEQLHRAGVIVRDIKPQNVLLDSYDSPVFADFGIAEIVQRTTQIRPTSMKGTFNYMAPEVFEPHGFGDAVDIWSMGCVILEMSTGSQPWAGLQMQQIMMAVAIWRKRPDVPDSVPAAEIVRTCFAFDPQSRPTALELADAFSPRPIEFPSSKRAFICLPDPEGPYRSLRDAEQGILYSDLLLTWTETLAAMGFERSAIDAALRQEPETLQEAICYSYSRGVQTERLLREQKHNFGACLSRQRYLPTNPKKTRVQNWTELGSKIQIPSWQSRHSGFAAFVRGGLGNPPSS
jgi:serine/threonine protein kinase